jgi:hypothetical protein
MRSSNKFLEIIQILGFYSFTKLPKTHFDYKWLQTCKIIENILFRLLFVLVESCRLFSGLCFSLNHLLPYNTNLKESTPI